jgi:hypothetical protein
VALAAPQVEVAAAEAAVVVEQVAAAEEVVAEVERVETSLTVQAAASEGTAARGAMAALEETDQ